MTRIDLEPASARLPAVIVALVVLLVACSSPSGAGSSWSFGPSLEPEASGSAAPPASAAAPSASAAAPSASVAASASPAAASASPGASGSPAASSGATSSLTIGTREGDELEFEPDEVSVPANSEVAITFQNRSGLPHNLTFPEPINVATSPAVAAGGSETITFPASPPGDYPFMCTIHAGMSGTLTVEAGG